MNLDRPGTRDTKFEDADDAHGRGAAMPACPGDLAFMDLREEGQFGEGHPLFAVPCRYSRPELRILVLVP